VEEDERGTYIFNSKDLCLLQQLPKLVAAGVDSIKIEGRMKSMGYIGQVVRVYRAALNWIDEQGVEGEALSSLVLPEEYAREISKAGTRGQTENFFEGTPSSRDMIYDSMRVMQSYAPAAVILEDSPLLVEARNVMEPGDTLEYLGQGIRTLPVTVKKLRDQDGQEVKRANPGNKVFLETTPKLAAPELHTILRKKI
jgi:putative protease